MHGNMNVKFTCGNISTNLMKHFVHPFLFWEILLRKLWRLCKVVIAVDWHVFGITRAWGRRHESRISLRIWLDISGTWHFLYTCRDRGNMEEHTRDRGWLLSLIRKHNRYRSVTLLRREEYMRSLKLNNRSRFIIGLYKTLLQQQMTARIAF
jgi:hypothetical protein